MDFNDLKVICEQDKELEELFKKNLYEILKNRCKGHIYVNIEESQTVYVSIRAYDIKFEYAQRLRSDVVTYMHDSNHAVFDTYCDIMKAYVHFIDSRFFIKETKNENNR